MSDFTCLGGVVDLVRRRENKQLKAAGDDRLTGTRHYWLRHPARVEPDDRKQFAARRVFRSAGREEIGLMLTFSHIRLA